MTEAETSDEKVVVAASGFTSLWALTWLGVSAVSASTAVTGGFAVGGVMAGSGLAALWWKAKRVEALHAQAEAEDEPRAAESPIP